MRSAASAVPSGDGISPKPAGQPLSISRDFPSGVTNKVAAPPSTSMETMRSGVSAAAGAASSRRASTPGSVLRSIPLGPLPSRALNARVRRGRISRPLSAGCLIRLAEAVAVVGHGDRAVFRDLGMDGIALVRRRAEQRLNHNHNHHEHKKEIGDHVLVAVPFGMGIVLM